MDRPRLSLGQPRRRAQTPRAHAPRQPLRGPAAVRATDSDALVSRIAAARAGYLPPDPYAQLLAPDASADARRPPLINIGTYPVSYTHLTLPTICSV